jgi:hypothetical protein
MPAILHDGGSVEEDGQGGASSNSSNTTATQQGGQGPHEHIYTHEHEPIFEFTSWDQGLDFFDLPASVAGGETARYCGDAVVDSGEDCDDGTGNGPAFRCRCRSLSFSLTLFSFHSLCPPPPPPPPSFCLSLTCVFPLAPSLSLSCARGTVRSSGDKKVRCVRAFSHTMHASLKERRRRFVILL